MESEEWKPLKGKGSGKTNSGTVKTKVMKLFPASESWRVLETPGASLASPFFSGFGSDYWKRRPSKN